MGESCAVTGDEREVAEHVLSRAIPPTLWELAEFNARPRTRDEQKSRLPLGSATDRWRGVKYTSCSVKRKFLYKVCTFFSVCARLPLYQTYKLSFLF